MVQINGGVVSFERTVKVADFEPKKAKVELSFTVPEGVTKEEADMAVGHVLNLAKEKCHAILGIKTQAAAPAAVAPAAPAERTKDDLVAEAEAAAKKPAASKVAKLPIPASQATPATTVEPPLPFAAPATPAPVSDGLDELTSPAPPAEITDAELIHKVQTTNNDVIKNPLGIRQLAAKIGGLKSLHSVTQVPQEKRAEFLAALAAMAAAVKAAKQAA